MVTSLGGTVRRIALSVTVAILLGLGINPVPVSADERVGLQVSRPLVVMGSPSTLSPTITNVSEASSYDWTAYKYEIIVPDDISVSVSYRVVQANVLECTGSRSGSGALSACTGYLSRGVNVLQGGTAVGQIPNTNLSLTGHSIEEFRVSVTGWLDSDGNNKVSPFEPKTPLSIVEFVPSSKIASSINFEVDPPGRHSGSIQGWISDSSGREGWGQGLSQVLNLQNFRVFVERCVSSSGDCVINSYSPTLEVNNQLRSYRFNMVDEWVGYDKTKITLVHFDTPDHFTVMATKVFDYSGERVTSATTGVTGSVQPSAPRLPLAPAAREKVTHIPDSSPNFEYRARFLGSKGQPMVNELVDIRVEATQRGSIAGLSVDGRPLDLLLDGSSGSSRDVVWLQRRTDSDGSVVLRFEDSRPTIWSSVILDAQVRGYEAHHLDRGGNRERVVWQPSRRELAVVTSSLNSGRDLSIRVQLIGPLTYAANPPVIEFVSSENLLFQHSFMRMPILDVNASSGFIEATNRLRVRMSSFTTGSELVRVRVKLAGVTYESSLVVAFDGLKGTLNDSLTGGSGNTSDAGTTGNVRPEANAIIGSFNGRWSVRVENAKGAVVSVKVGGRWFRYTALSDNYSFNRKSVAGATLPIRVYINGALENVATITVR